MSSSGSGVIFPRTLDGAHQRLDYHETRIDEIVDSIGDEPAPVQGKGGRGLLLFLHKVHEAQNDRRAIEEAEMAVREKWRLRWTILASVLGIIVAGVSLINAVRAWFFTGH